MPNNRTTSRVQGVSTQVVPKREVSLPDDLLELLGQYFTVALEHIDEIVNVLCGVCLR